MLLHHTKGPLVVQRPCKRALPARFTTRRLAAAPVHARVHRRVSVISLASAAPAYKDGARPKNTVRGVLRGFWTFVDVVAILGSVGGALAALLGVVSASYVLPLPVVLPVVSLIAAMQREGLISQVRFLHCSCCRVNQVSRNGSADIGIDTICAIIPYDIACLPIQDASLQTLAAHSKHQPL